MQRLGLTPGPGRVQKDYIGRFGQSGYLGHHVFSFAQEKLYVVQSGGVFPGVGNGGRRLLHGVNFFHVGSQQYCKGADPGIGIQQYLVAREVESFAYYLDQPACLLNIDLEKGG